MGKGGAIPLGEDEIRKHLIGQKMKENFPERYAHPPHNILCTNPMEQVKNLKKEGDLTLIDH